MYLLPTLRSASRASAARAALMQARPRRPQPAPPPSDTEAFNPENALSPEPSTLNAVAPAPSVPSKQPGLITTAPAALTPASAQMITSEPNTVKALRRPGDEYGPTGLPSTSAPAESSMPQPTPSHAQARSSSPAGSISGGAMLVAPLEPTTPQTHVPTAAMSPAPSGQTLSFRPHVAPSAAFLAPSDSTATVSSAEPSAPPVSRLLHLTLKSVCHDRAMRFVAHWAQVRLVSWLAKLWSSLDDSDTCCCFRLWVNLPPHSFQVARLCRQTALREQSLLDRDPVPWQLQLAQQLLASS